MPPLEFEARADSGVRTELARNAVVVKIRNTAVNAEGDFVAPEESIASVTVADALRIEAVIAPVVEFIDTEESHALPLNEPGGVPKPGGGIVCNGGEGVASSQCPRADVEGARRFKRQFLCTVRGNYQP